jgi:tetratricopeptide (TPR) repeat protein
LSAFLCAAAASSSATAEPLRAQKKPAPAASANADKTRAADLFKKSADAYLHGDFAKAISLLDEAYALDPQPVLIYNKARAHEGLGHTDEAISLYERYLKEEPTSSDRGAIEQRLTTLRKQQEDKKRLDQEKAEVEKKRVEQQAQQQQLERREREVQNAPPRQPRKRSIGPYVVAGVGAAGLAAGAVFGILAIDKQSEGRKAVSMKEATAARDTGQTFATVTNISFIAGGALVAVGAVWWVLDGNAVKRANGATVGLGVGPSQLSVVGAF